MAKQIVITGGPNSGKTTIIKHLRKKFTQAGVIFLPEAASILAGNGFPLPDEGYPWSQYWQNELQDAILATQQAMENVAQDKCASTGIECIVQDRGLLDIAIYLEDGVKSLKLRYGIHEDTVHSRYSAIILLDSIANYGEDYFSKHISKNKIHDYFDRNIEYDLKAREVWKNHPNLQQVFSKDLNKKIERVEQILNDHL